MARQKKLARAQKQVLPRAAATDNGIRVHPGYVTVTFQAPQIIADMLPAAARLDDKGVNDWIVSSLQTVMEATFEQAHESFPDDGSNSGAVLPCAIGPKIVN